MEGRATPTVWLAGCAAALLALWLPSCRPPALAAAATDASLHDAAAAAAAAEQPWLRRLFSVYLAAHIASNALRLLDEPGAAVRTLSVELVLLAAATYFFIGTELLVPRRRRARRRTLVVNERSSMVRGSMCPARNWTSLAATFFTWTWLQPDHQHGGVYFVSVN